MVTPVRTIDQAGIRALLHVRLEHPEPYADKPLFIWQSAWHDGIQEGLVSKTCLDLNKGKPRDEWRYFRLITVRKGGNHLNSPDRKDKGRLSGYVINTRTLTPDNYLREVGRLIEENNNAVPLIVYLPYRYEPGHDIETCFGAEQLLFTPDFEKWTETWADSTIPDFIRGDGDEDGIAYRWYNLFNDPNKGCSTPLVWLAVGYNLNGLIKEPHYIRDLDEALIRSAIQAGVNASGGHISDDVINDFVKHLKANG